MGITSQERRLPPRYLPPKYLPHQLDSRYSRAIAGKERKTSLAHKPKPEETAAKYKELFSYDKSQPIRNEIFQAMASIYKTLDESNPVWWQRLRDAGKARNVGLQLYNHVLANEFQTNPAKAVSILAVSKFSELIVQLIKGNIVNENNIGNVDDTFHYMEACILAQLFITECLQKAQQFCANPDYVPGTLVKYLETAFE